MLAAVAVLNMDDAGFIGPAAAMCAVIMASSAVASLALHLASRAMLARRPGAARCRLTATIQDKDDYMTAKTLPVRLEAVIFD